MRVRRTPPPSRTVRIVVLAGSLLLVACDSLKNVERRNIEPQQFRNWDSGQIEKTRKESPFLKAHMRNGDLFVLQDWSAVAGSDVVGEGTHYDMHRRVLGTGHQQVPIDSVAVFETNELVTSGAMVALSAMAVVTAAVAIYCASNPKNCFGSCPTFYIGDAERPVAEGFSSSIAPSLEATDVDVVPRVPGGGPLEIVMRNEALETHVVRFVNVLAAPRGPDSRVFADVDGSFWESSHVLEPLDATGPEGDILALVRDADHRERFSLADSTCLSTSETLEFTFDTASAPAQCGIVIGCRQSLLSTYLLYQTLAYMGTQAGHWFAEMERGHLDDVGERLLKVLGGVVVRVETSPGVWTEVGEIDEFGPIATDRHLVAFHSPQEWTGRVQLELTQGGWRIDDVSLAVLDRRVEPLRIGPADVARDGASDPSALAVLLDPDRSLTTLPGDTYTLLYDTPRDRDYELFIESRGYYLEWIREQWLHEESSTHLVEMFLDPRAALTRLAPDYKRMEPGMEQAFWSSRYEKP